jgi:hypothetical protein
VETDQEPTVPVTVEIDASLSTPVQIEGAQALTRRLEVDLKTLFGQLGVAGRPVVEVRQGDTGRAVRVRAHGILQPYPPERMRRVWLSMTAGQAGTLPEPDLRRPGPSGFPDAWLSSYATTLASDDDPDWRPLVDYLGRLVLDVIRIRPACLIGPEQATAYLREASDESIDYPAGVSPDALSSVLKSLLNLGVSVANRVVVLEAMRTFGPDDDPAESEAYDDAIEEAFAQLRSRWISIHAHPAYLQELLSHAPMTGPLSVYAAEIGAEFHEPFRRLEEMLTAEPGLPLPDLAWIPSPRMRPGMVAVGINDGRTLPIPGPKPAESVPGRSVEQAPPATDTATGSDDTGGSAGSGVDEERLGAEAASIADLWEPTMGRILADIRSMADRLLSVEDVEYQLARLEETHPLLVQAATARLSLGDLTRMLRGLLREGVSIGDLRSILERLLRRLRRAFRGGQWDTNRTHPAMVQAPRIRPSRSTSVPRRQVQPGWPRAARVRDRARARSPIGAGGASRPASIRPRRPERG